MIYTIGGIYMKRLLTLVLAFTVITLGACAGAKEEKKSETAGASGAEAYQNSSCIGCHGKDLEGASGPNLTKVGSKYSQKEIEDIIKNGKGSMPKNQAEGEDAKKIAEYLSEQK